MVAKLAIAAMLTPDHHMLMAGRDAIQRVATTHITESEVLHGWLAAVNQALREDAP